MDNENDIQMAVEKLMKDNGLSRFLVVMTVK